MLIRFRRNKGKRMPRSEHGTDRTDQPEHATPTRPREAEDLHTLLTSLESRRDRDISPTANILSSRLPTPILPLPSSPS